VLDPQGAAVRDAMRHLGMPEVRSVRIGKFMDIEIDGGGVEMENRLHVLCRDLLSNPVIEQYELQKLDPNGTGQGSEVDHQKRKTGERNAKTRRQRSQIKGQTKV
jgi:phosphoribosylformylglycinamidine synthase subunit PurS